MLTQDRSHLDYGKLVRASKRCDEASFRVRQRLAILSDAAVPQLVPLLKALLARQGIGVDVYLAEYDAIELEAFDAGSGLYEFGPDVVVILSSPHVLRLSFFREVADRDGFADRAVARIAAVWDAVRSRTSAIVIQSNYALPYERTFGNFDHKVTEAFYPAVLRANAAIAQQARERTQVLINDVEALASYEGRRHWWDDRFWSIAKGFCALQYLPLVAQNIVDIVASNLGRVVKCVVVDLDNTLWGGIVGDDGVEGILIDPFGEGEPFHRLQHFLLELKRRGIILAVCSKNEHANAIEPFRSHPEMVLKEDDFAVFVANWQPKPDNIKHIREVLNIGFDSMVFLDDNIFERQLVRETLPEVVVPELPEDPADYVRVISELNLFETTSFSDEDRRRADLYRVEASRQQVQTQFSDISEYLRSLDMQVTMQRFDPVHLPRIAQLLQRSNQFNLTTHRYTLPECEAMMRAEGGCLPLYVKLADRYGDNGLISVIILRPQPPVVEVDSWLMSCRVLGRGVEAFSMNRVVEIAKQHGCETVMGTYIPTPKNGMVQDFFGRFGFEQTEVLGDGGARWRLQVAAYEPRDVYMREVA